MKEKREVESILKKGVSFEFIKENCQTIRDIQKISEKIEFYKKEKLANKNISKIFNPKNIPNFAYCKKVSPFNPIKNQKSNFQVLNKSGGTK